VQGNFVMQNLLHAAAKLRGAAQLLRARGGTPDAELARVVGAGVGGTDAFGARHPHLVYQHLPLWKGGGSNKAPGCRSPPGAGTGGRSPSRVRHAAGGLSPSPCAQTAQTPTPPAC
jgi:hypothetical protein